MSKGQGVPIFVGAVVVGRVVGDTFYKRLKASRHFLQQPPAIGFDLTTIDDARAAGAVFVEVTDSESGHVYRASIGTILSYGLTVDRQHGKQVALALGRWRINNHIATNPAPEDGPTQAAFELDLDPPKARYE